MNEKEVVLGFDVGGTKMLAGVIDRSGTILFSQKQPVCLEGCEAMLQSFCSAGDSLLASLSPEYHLIGIGIAFKGHIDAERNRLISSSLLGGKVDFDFCERLNSHFGVPAYIDNDVNAAAIAEMLLDHCGKCFTYINVGTGTAVGVVENGKLIRGSENFSGEIGYMLMRLKDENRLFQLEDIASGKGLDAEVRRLCTAYPDSPLGREISDTTERVSAARVFEQYEEGDPLAKAAVDHAVDVLAEAVLHIDTVTASEQYVFGGGVMQPFFFEKLCNAISGLCKEFSLPREPKMRLSSLGTANVGLLGSACLAIEKMEPESTRC